VADVESLRARLDQLAEDLADAALDCLREAAAGGEGAELERRLTRARRAVERASAILGRQGDQDLD